MSAHMRRVRAALERLSGDESSSHGPDSENTGRHFVGTREPKGAQVEQTSASAAQSGYVPTSMRVLVIDDDEIAREIIGDILRGAGHEVFELSSAMGATQAVYRHNVDAVVLDVNMPTVKGDKLAGLLRGSKKGESLWVVLVSAQTRSDLRKLADDCKADATVSKEAIHTELLDAMTRGAARVASAVASAPGL